MSESDDENRPEFSVCQFFRHPAGTYEYVRRYVTAKEAWDAFVFCIGNVASREGLVTRVIITDGGDYTNAEWKFGEGLTFPKVKNRHTLYWGD